jgi:flagellar biosynthesis protein FlhG
MVITQNREAKIIPIAGGKGGVGKTELCANLGVRLGQLGYRTIVIDLDLGGSNLHSTLGIKNKNSGLGNFLSDRALGFNDIIYGTPYPNLDFVPGDVLVANTPNVTFAQKRSIIRNIERIDADYILLDLGSGANNNVVDFFLASNSGIIVSSPHVGAILNAYSFLKNTTFRFLMRAFSGDSAVEKYIRQTIKERRPGNPVNVQTVIDGMREIDPTQADRAVRILGYLQPLLVINLVRTPEDLNIATSLRDLVGKNLSYSLEALGFVMADEELARSHRAHNPHVLEAPESLMPVRWTDWRRKSSSPPTFPIWRWTPACIGIPTSYSGLKPRPTSRNWLPHPRRMTPMIRPGNSSRSSHPRKKRIQELQNTVRMLTIRNP